MSPRRRVAAALLAFGVAVGIVGSGCALLGGSPSAAAPGLPADASTAQVVADDVVQSLNDAWKAAADACLAANDAGIIANGQCAKYLLPAYDALQAMGAGVDAWNAGASDNWPCLVQNAVTAMADMDSALMAAGVNIPPSFQTALATVRALPLVCAAEAGASDVLAPSVIVVAPKDGGQG